MLCVLEKERGVWIIWGFLGWGVWVVEVILGFVKYVLDVGVVVGVWSWGGGGL